MERLTLTTDMKIIVVATKIWVLDLTWTDFQTGVLGDGLGLENSINIDRY